MAQSSRGIYCSAILADSRRSGMTHVEFRRRRRISLNSFRTRLAVESQDCLAWRLPAAGSGSRGLAAGPRGLAAGPQAGSRGGVSLMEARGRPTQLSSWAYESARLSLAAVV
jgi:hypothetical protein